MKRALLALILALPLALSAQFRIVGTGLFTTLNDSTYRAKIDFRPDLTGNSYNATQLNDSMLVLSQKGQLYRLESFYNASFSSAFIVVVEKNGDWGSPVGQVMVFQNNSSLAAPQAVYGANGATAGMQAGVDTWNSLLLKVVSDSAVYWNQAYSNSIDSLNVSGDSLKTITLYRAGGDSISATFVDGGGSGPVTDTLTGEVKGPLDSTYIDTVANIIFTTTTDTTVGVGELEYNDTQGSLIQGLKGGNVTNVIGQQIHQRVTNATGAPLTKGTAVFLHGSQGTRITVRKALATADSTSANTFGIVAESIANNQSGYVITEGLITNMNTNALTEGAAVYLSPTVAGELTTTKPQAPQHTVYIGVCVKQNAGSGELFVKIRNGQELDELHDVRIDSLASNASLYYNAAQGVWRDTTAAALKSDISGTTNRLAMFTGANAVGNSIVTQNGRSVYINSTQDNSGYNISNLFQFNGFGSSATDQPSIGVIGNVGTSSTHRPYLSMYRSAGSTVDDKTLVPYNYHLGSITWQGADGNDFQSRGAEITAITDSITGVNDMPTALFFGTTANGQEQPTERMRITSNGLVGIRNATPVNILDVGHPTNSPLTDATIGLTSTLSAGTSKLALANGTVVKGDMLTTSNATVIGTGGMAIQTTTNHPIIFRTNSSGVESGGNERMRIAQDGNIGIGTTAPRTPLDIRFSGSYPNYYTDTIARVEFNETGAGCCMDITGMYVKANGGGGQSNVGIIGEGGGVNYDKSIGIKGIAKHNDTQGPGIAYGVIGEVSASKLGSSGAIGTTIAGYFKNTAKVDGTHYGVLVETDSSGDYGVYQTGFGANYFKGNVGIATASPSRPLHVNANSSMIIPSGATGTRPASGADGDLRYSTTFNNIEFYDGSRGLWERPLVGTVANNKVAFASGDTLTSNTNFHWDNTNTRLGIGNAVPDSTLTVTGGGNFSGGVSARNYTLPTTGNRPALGMYSRIANRLSFATNDTLRFEILASGTATLSAAVTSPTAPAFALTVNGGGIQARNYLNLNGDSLANSAPQITVLNQDVATSGGYVVFQKRRGGSGAVQNGDEVGTFSWGAKINATAGIFASAGFRANVAGTVTDTFAPVDFTIFTSPRSDGSTFRVPVKTDRLTIKPSGRVGINTASPSATLHVNGNLSRNAPITITDATHTVDSLTNWIICSRTSTITLTLPTASSWTGREIMIKTIEPQAVISASSNVVPLIGGAAGTSILGTVGTPPADGAWCTLVSDGTNWIIMQQR